jgi:hypothetical protein
MADTVQIGNTGHTAKIRHPVAVAIFSLITLGIYYVYWWYQVNREVVDLGRARNVTGLGDNPTLSALAVFPGVLVIVPPFFTLYNGVKRFQRAQQAVLDESTLNGICRVDHFGIHPGRAEPDLGEAAEAGYRCGRRRQRPRSDQEARRA